MSFGQTSVSLPPVTMPQSASSNSFPRSLSRKVSTTFSFPSLRRPSTRTASTKSTDSIIAPSQPINLQPSPTVSIHASPVESLTLPTQSHSSNSYALRCHLPAILSSFGVNHCSNSNNSNAKRSTKVEKINSKGSAQAEEQQQQQHQKEQVEPLSASSASRSSSQSDAHSESISDMPLKKKWHTMSTIRSTRSLASSNSAVSSSSATSNKSTSTKRQSNSHSPFLTSSSRSSASAQLVQVHQFQPKPYYPSSPYQLDAFEELEGLALADHYATNNTMLSSSPSMMVIASA